MSYSAFIHYFSPFVTIMCYIYLRLVFICIICICTIFFSHFLFCPQISIIVSTTIPSYPLTLVLVITNIFVSYELPVVARLLSFQIFKFYDLALWRVRSL